MSLRASAIFVSLTLSACGTAPQSAAPKQAPTSIEWITRSTATLDVRHPRFGRPDGIDRTIEVAIGARIAAFEMAAEPGWRLRIACAVIHPGPWVASVRCMLEEHRGGAHPKEGAIAFNQRLDRADPPFGIERIVRSAKPVSDWCVAELRAQKAQWILDGMTEVEKLLHTVNVDAKGLLITFDPFEVGAGAEGFHEVRIDWSRVRALVDASSPVAELSR